MIYATFAMALVSMIVVKFGCYQFFWSQICKALLKVMLGARLWGQDRYP
jgi:hypothetical protein